MRTIEERRRILELYNNGLNHSEISRAINISRTTIRDIIKKYSGEVSNLEKELNREITYNLNCNSPLAKDYAYILGVYLGDGYIDKLPRTERFRIFQDVKYTDIIKRESEALQRLLPNNKINLINHGQGCKAICIHSTKLSEIFPQHGIGRKHDRLIELENWQREVIKKYPKQFIRGLIETDGCRYISSQYKGKDYVAYQFTNKSKDIINLCCNALEYIDIKYIVNKRKAGAYDVRVYRQKDVAFLDTFIGPKS